MKFDKSNIGTAIIVDQHPAYDFVYDVEIPIRVIAQACGHDNEGIAKLLGVGIGRHKFRAYAEPIDVHCFSEDEFDYPSMNRVGSSLEEIATVVVAEWLSDMLYLSREYGHELPAALDIPFEQACTKPAWYTAPEDKAYDLPSSRDDAPAKGMIIRDGVVEGEAPNGTTVVPGDSIHFEVFTHQGKTVVDLPEGDGTKVLPDGWEFVIEDGCYTGWDLGEGNGVRFACVQEINWF